MKTILVLTDFSIRAGYAAEYAMHIAMKNKANILLCHAMELTSHLAEGVEFTWPIADHLLLKNESILDLKALATRLENLIPEDGQSFRPVVSYITEFGLVSEIAEKIIPEKQVGLVVMGSHKSTGLARFLFGSHTHTVLDKVNCPVLLVPESMKFKSIRNIAYATDLTFNNTSVVNYLAALAKPFNATISVNHISPNQFPHTESEQAIYFSLKEQLGPDQPPIVYHTIKGDNVKTTLLELTGSGKVDILTLVHKRYDFFEKLFHSSISKQIADTAKVPLLVLPYSFSLDTSDLTNDQLDHFLYETNESR